MSFNPSVHQQDNPERTGMPITDTTLGVGVDLRERITLWLDDGYPHPDGHQRQSLTAKQNEMLLAAHSCAAQPLPST